MKIVKLAIEPTVGKFWTLVSKANTRYDLCHRTDGPAIVWPNGEMAFYENDQLLREVK